MSPTELTLKQLRAEGYRARVVEQTIHAAGRVFKRDCFGFDVLAVRNGLPCSGGDHFVPQILGVQAGSDNGGAHAAHRARLLANEEAARWICAGGRIEIWSWSTRRSLERTKAGKRSKRLVHHLRREEIRLSDFVPDQSAEQPREAIT